MAVKEKLNHTDFDSVISHSAIPMALLHNHIIVAHNDEMLGILGSDNAKGQKIDSFIAEEYAYQLNWLMQSRRKDCDKTVLKLKDDSEDSILAQFWPINAEYCLFSFVRDFLHDRIADLDVLTQIPNRRHAVMLLDAEIKQAERNDGFCLALCDIDHFKSINDTHGHNTGDDVLRYVTGVISSELRKGDWTARWGGEEFLIFIKNGDLATGLQPLERIKEKLNKQNFAGPPAVPVTMSFGVVSSVEQEKPLDMDALVQNADLLMYESKAHGRNRISWKNQEGMVWGATDIKNAIADGAVIPAFTPIYDWQKRVVAIRVTPGVKGSNSLSAKRLLVSSNNLHLRADVDWAMLQQLQTMLVAHTQSQVPLFISLSNSMVKHKWAELRPMFGQHPLMHVGISAHDSFLGDNINKISDERLPIALLDFNADKNILSPVYYLRSDIRYVVFSAVDKNTAPILQILPRAIRCFCSDTTVSESQLQQHGFYGTMREADEQPQLPTL